MALQDHDALVPVALIARAEADRIRIDDVLRSFGYYDAVIDVQLEGSDLARSALPELLAGRVGGPAARVTSRSTLGRYIELPGSVSTVMCRALPRPPSICASASRPRRAASNRPAGGDASPEASVELRRRLGGPWGLVAFADAGSWSSSGCRSVR